MTFPEHILEPPDEPSPDYLTCIICDDDYSEEDMVQVYDKALCIWCASSCGKAVTF